MSKKGGGESRVQGRLVNLKRKYGQMEGNWVLEMNTLVFKFQFCSLLAICIYSTSLSLSSLLRKIRLIYRVALRSKYFIESVQFSVNGAAIIMIMMTDIKGVILCLPPMIWTSLFSLYFQCFLHFSLPPSTPNTAYSPLSMLIFLLAKKINMSLKKSQQKVHI